MDAHTGWYLVFTKPNHENIAETNLQRQGFQTYLPRVQQHKHRRNLYQVVTESLFPRYLFIYLNSDIDDWSKIRSTRGCIALVRFGMYPARVPDVLIEKIQKSEVLNTKKLVNSTPDFQPGDLVRIVDGILTDYEGIVEIKNRQERITVLLTIAEGHTRSINLSVHQVKAVS